MSSILLVSSCVLYYLYPLLQLWLLLCMSSTTYVLSIPVSYTTYVLSHLCSLLHLSSSYLCSLLHMSSLYLCSLLHKSSLYLCSLLHKSYFYLCPLLPMSSLYLCSLLHKSYFYLWYVFYISADKFRKCRWKNADITEIKYLRIISIFLLFLLICSDFRVFFFSLFMCCNSISKR